jgi:hypothetical protein
MDPLLHLWGKEAIRGQGVSLLQLLEVLDVLSQPLQGSYAGSDQQWLFVGQLVRGKPPLYPILRTLLPYEKPQRISSLCLLRYRLAIEVQALNFLTG